MMTRVATVIAIAIGLVLGTSTRADVTQQTYKVALTSEQQQTFLECFRFDTPTPHDLSLDVLGQTLVYAHGQFDTDGRRFMAVSRSGQVLAIMFSGYEVTPAGQITGEAVSENGDTWVFLGTPVDQCDPLPADPTLYGAK